jgi:hypothetical protein
MNQLMKRLFRAVVVGGPNDDLSPFVRPDDGNPGGFMYLDVKRAWVLSDGKLELERYDILADSSTRRDADGNMIFRTTVLDRWTVRNLNKLGQTVNERYSAGK